VLNVAAARFDTRVMGAAINRLLLLARESKRLRVSLSTRQFVSIRSGSGEPSRPGPPRKRTEGIDEEPAFRNIYRCESCRELRSLRLVHLLDNPQHENKTGTWRISESTRSSLRGCNTLLAR
jgi:hypothetical protein